MGCSPMGTMGLGSSSVMSRRRVPLPPQRIMAGGIGEVEGVLCMAFAFDGQKKSCQVISARRLSVGSGMRRLTTQKPGIKIMVANAK